MENKTTKWERFRNIWINSVTARNILKVSIGDITSKVFSFATVFLLIRGLSITDYAAFTTFAGISVLFSGIVGTGINMAVVRFSSDALSRGNEKPLVLYTLAILVQILLYLLVAGVCLAFPKQCTTLLFGGSGFSMPLKLGLMAGLGLLIIQFTRSLYQAAEEFTKYIGVLWLVQVLTFISLIALRVLGYLSFVPVAVTFMIIQVGIGLWILLKHFSNFRLSTLSTWLLIKKRELQQFVIASGWLIGYFLVLNLFSRMDVLMLLRFKGVRELAIYGVAFQYYSLALLFLGSIHAVLLPKFARADMEDVEKQNAFLRRWLRWSIWLIIPILVFDWLGRPLFIWLSGAQYEDSFAILVVFSFGIWLSMMFSPLVNILIGKGNFRFLFLLSLVALCANIQLNLLLVPSLGGLGAALAVVSSISIINIFSFIKIQAE